MFFKSLEIHGFKSFADKTVLNFDAQTTAVVGSNGNGKSNISDALRWVMGEQGAKTLRGEKMEDVIFHGTTDRKPMGFAKVALCIDNTDRALAVDADEVTISRKLYRTGESEYLINGAKSRLKDIQEMLLGTGLGRDGYSIIGQGRVAEIVNARGTQRREIFEEAAGISLFLHKKAEAEKELESAEENITRQKDIIRSDEERLPVLKKQSEKAVLAAALLAQKKELEISVGAARYEERRTAIKKLDDDLLLNRAECEHFEKDAEKLQNSIEESTEKKQRIQAELERFRSKGQHPLGHRIAGRAGGPIIIKVSIQPPFEPAGGKIAPQLHDRTGDQGLVDVWIDCHEIPPLRKPEQSAQNCLPCQGLPC